MIEPEDPGVVTRTMPLAEEPASRQALHEELRRLRSLFNTALLAMLLLSVAVNAYLFYQDRIVRRELNGVRKMLQEFQTVKWPLVSKLAAGLQSFAQTNSDINPILEKYGIKPSAAGPSPQSAPVSPPAAGRTGK